MRVRHKPGRPGADSGAYEKQRSPGLHQQTHGVLDVPQSIVNLATCILGAGALGYPFCFKECGLVLATIIMLGTLVATRVSYQLLLYCSQLSSHRTYEGIAEQALGKSGRLVVEACIAAMNLGALVAFLDILADVLSAVAGTIIPPGAEPSRHAYIIGVTLAGALPVCLAVRDHALIAALSNASVVFVVIFAGVVFCTAFAPFLSAQLAQLAVAGSAAAVAAATASTGAVAEPPAGAQAAAAGPVLHMWHGEGVLVALPVMAYGFTAHQYYMGIYAMLKAPSVRKMKRVTDAALLACAGVYWIIGVGGYATFGERTAGDIVRNLGGARAVGLLGAYERALKLCYGLAILGNIPLVILPFYNILRPLLPAEQQLKARCSASSSCSASSGGGGGSVRHGGRWWQPSADGAGSGSGGSRRPSQGEDLAALLESQTSRPSIAAPCSRDELSVQQVDAHTAAVAPAGPMLSAAQHALVVVVVLGVGLASALFLPNVELIFGLTGSTASVLVAFIVPAVCFIRLYSAAPELGGGALAFGSELRVLRGCWLVLRAAWSAAAAGGSLGLDGLQQQQHQQQPTPRVHPVLVVPELRAQWLCRQRMAVVLLLFGVVSGLLCTDAILGSIREEKAVVQLAQELVAHEAVVAEANRAEQQAREAEAAVAAVGTAAQMLWAVGNDTTTMLSSLGAAAVALDNVRMHDPGDDGSSHGLLDLMAIIRARRRKEEAAAGIKNAQAAMSTAVADVDAVVRRVAAVVARLDATIHRMDHAATAPTGPPVLPAPQTMERVREITGELSNALSSERQAANASAEAGGCPQPLAALQRVSGSTREAWQALNATSHSLHQLNEATNLAWHAAGGQKRQQVLALAKEGLNATLITGMAVSSTARDGASELLLALAASAAASHSGPAVSNGKQRTLVESSTGVGV